MAIFNWRFSRRNFLAGGSVFSALAGRAPRRLLASPGGLTGTPAAPANIYERLGVRTRINAKGTYTNLTGSLLPPEAARAMEEAAQHYVVLDELQRAVGERIAGYVATNWYGLFAPRGLPPPVLARLAAEIAKARADPVLVERSRAAGMTMILSAPEVLRAKMESEVPRWQQLIAELGLKAE